MKLPHPYSPSRSSRVKKPATKWKTTNAFESSCVKLVGEPSVDGARDYGYHNGSGVSQVIRRLEQQAEDNPPLRAKLHQFKVTLYEW